MADELADLGIISERLQGLLARAESDPELRQHLLSAPRETLEAEGVPLPPDGEIDVAEAPGGRLFVGVPVAPEACVDIRIPHAAHESPHHLDCA